MAGVGPVPAAGPTYDRPREEAAGAATIAPPGMNTQPNPRLPLWGANQISKGRISFEFNALATTGAK